jgi:hypothetical protein
MFRALILAALCGAFGAPAWADAQSERIDALERRLERSALLVEQLAARIAELERAARSAAPVAAAGGAGGGAEQAQTQTQAITALQESVNQISSGLNQRGTDSGVPLHGFADVGAAWSSGDDPIKLRGFNGGTLDIYLTPQFGQRAKGLVELAVEYGPDGVAGLDMERLQIGYTVSDALTLWAGRFHTPFGLWNTSFHHGANLQTAITRPRFIDFEDKGGIIPAHSVGAWASGRTSAGGGKLTYDAFVANGPRIVGRELDFAAYTDDSANKMLGLNLGYQPAGALSGLTVGLHGFASQVRAYDASAAVINTTKLRMAGAYIGYDESDWELFGEYYGFANADASSGKGLSSRAWFTQLGRTFGQVTPFIRLEQAALDTQDNFFRSQLAGRPYRRAVAGLRYAVDPKSSFKFEFSSTSESLANLLDETGAVVPFAARSYRRGAFQYSVAF